MTRSGSGRLLVAVGTVGAVATLVGTVVGVTVLGSLDRSVRDSVVVTADALDALTATIEIADDVVGEVSSTLFDAALASRAAAGAAESTVDVLDGAAAVTGTEVAGSLESVEAALPALIDVAAVIDSTLGALDRLPVGPTYDPAVPFDDALRDVQQQLDGLPSSLRDQAALLRDGADELGDVGRSARFLGDDLEDLARTLDDTQEVLAEVGATAAAAAATLDEGAAGLTGGITALRVLVAVAGMALVLGQLVPVGLGWLLLDPARLTALLADGPAVAIDDD